MTAWTIYVLGGVLALKSIAAGLTSDSPIAWFTGIAYGVALWWVAVGFGVRLGVTPDDFVSSIKSGLGFGQEFDSRPEQSSDAPDRLG